MKKSLIFGSILVLSIFILLYSYYSRKNIKSSPDDSIKNALLQIQSRLDKNQIQIKQLGYEIANFRSNQKTKNDKEYTLDKREANTEDGELQSEHEEDMEKMRNELVMKTERVASNIDSKLRQDKKNTEWSFQAEEKIRSTFKNYGIEGSDVSQVKCSDSICRIEVTHHVVGNLQKVVEKALTEPPFRTSSTIIPEIPNGVNSETTVVYYSKENTPTLFSH